MMLNKEQLWNLRQQVCIGSLYYSDYGNDMGIDAHDCCDFFDGYIEYLEELMREDGYKSKGGITPSNEYYEWFNKYDNADNLENWYSCFADGDPLPTEYIECQWCHELFDKSEGKNEINMGFLCDRCIDALWSRGEKLYLEV